MTPQQKLLGPGRPSRNVYAVPFAALHIQCSRNTRRCGEEDGEIVSFATPCPFKMSDGAGVSQSLKDPLDKTMPTRQRRRNKAASYGFYG